MMGFFLTKNVIGRFKFGFRGFRRHFTAVFLIDYFLNFTMNGRFLQINIFYRRA